MRLRALSQLGRLRDARLILQPDLEEELRDALEGEGSGFAAYWGLQLSFILIEAGERSRARRWADFALSKDPAIDKLEKLLAMIRTGKPAGMAKRRRRLGLGLAGLGPMARADLVARETCKCVDTSCALAMEAVVPQEIGVSFFEMSDEFLEKQQDPVKALTVAVLSRNALVCNRLAFSYLDPKLFVEIYFGVMLAEVRRNAEFSRMETGRYPCPSVDEVIGRLPSEFRQRPPMQGRSLDPWGNEVELVCNSLAEGTYELISYGEDGLKGTEDDIRVKSHPR